MTDSRIEKKSNVEMYEGKIIFQDNRWIIFRDRYGSLIVQEKGEMNVSVRLCSSDQHHSPGIAIYALDGEMDYGTEEDKGFSLVRRPENILRTREEDRIDHLP